MFMEHAFGDLSQGNETILVERRKKKTSIPYADSWALVADMLEEICDNTDVRLHKDMMSTSRQLRLHKDMMST